MVELVSLFFWKPERLSSREEKEKEEEEKKTERRKEDSFSGSGGPEDRRGWSRAKRKGRGRGVLCRPWDKP